jgi:hypothetical protein
VIESHEDKGSATRPITTTSHYVQSLEAPPPPPFWRETSQVWSFDEELPRIYKERRLLIESEGHWQTTVEMVRRALLHRLRGRVPTQTFCATFQPLYERGGARDLVGVRWPGRGAFSSSHTDPLLHSASRDLS